MPAKPERKIKHNANIHAAKRLNKAELTAPFLDKKFSTQKVCLSIGG
jgi:hypothetical protein